MDKVSRFGCTCHDSSLASSGEGRPGVPKGTLKSHIAASQELKKKLCVSVRSLGACRLTLFGDSVADRRSTRDIAGGFDARHWCWLALLLSLLSQSKTTVL